MTPFVLTNAANSDLKKIARSTQGKWGNEQRNFYIKQFDDASHMLAKTPLAGKSCDETRAGYKKFPVGSHLIFYIKGENSRIKIVRILHKRTDVELNLQAP
ncbi:type II toxin-antitoxin system RelE/ParE family toxin [Thalassomonas actiniarum]|uniref:Toxin n=1 Tax=Thalassomonas actiniarum TaxID=485447 RepID=A0AAE9YTP6_9GAMM|nr:type II toxin-antitoxin system RelE/ParE family toxin [Thalassomonas actiniarum]WDE01016.1 type II toxin-antitoxin system RelE/ParE family toxin [Thalassomonas actiniarum]